MDLVRQHLAEATAASLATNDPSSAANAAISSGYWWTYHRSVEETWRRMQQQIAEGTESPESIQARMTALKRFVRERYQYKPIPDGVKDVVVVLVCHSEIIWWLSNTNPDWQSSEFMGDGIWTCNGEIVDLTEFVLG